MYVRRLVVSAALLATALSGCSGELLVPRSGTNNSPEQTPATHSSPEQTAPLQVPVAELTSLKGLIESDFGFRRANGTKYHFGLDIAVPKKTVVRAAAAGEVIYTGCDVTTRTLVLWHEQLGISTLYMHLLSFTAQPGQPVTAGQEIGRSGPESGFGPHLDFRVYKGKWPGDCPAVAIGAAAHYADPLRYLPRSLDTGAPAIAGGQILVSADKLNGFAAPKPGPLPITGPVWTRIRVTAPDKDVEDVRVLLKAPDGREIELHHFDYYAGDSAVNPTMPLEDDPGSDQFYVSVAATVEHSKPSDDLFAFRLDRDLTATTGGVYRLVYRVVDAYDNWVDVTLPFVRQ